MDGKNKGGGQRKASPRAYVARVPLTLEEAMRLQELAGATGRSKAEILIGGELAPMRGDGGIATTRRA